MWIRRTSFVVNSLAIAAIVGLMLLPILVEARKQVKDLSGALTSWNDRFSAQTWAHSARLVIESQKGFTNEPLPLGVSLEDASGSETVTVASLTKGIELSLGSSLDLARWLISARDLDQTFVGAPKDFVGVIDATVILHSASGQLLESRVLRLEWVEKKGEGLLESSDQPTRLQRSRLSRPTRLRLSRHAVPSKFRR